MRYLLPVLAVVFALLVAASQISLGESEEGFTPNQTQIQFAQSVKGSVSGVESAEWKNHIDLWVSAPGADQNRATEIAGDVAAKGSKDLGQMFCVHVHGGDWKAISKLCWTY